MKRNIYIDGENLVHIILGVLRDHKLLRRRRQLDNFDLRYLIDSVARLNPAKPQHIRYYGAKLQVLKEPAELAKLSQEMVAWNAKWVNVLQRQKIDFVKCGNLRVRDGHACRFCGKADQIFLEKGVDVGMAVDIVSDALKGTTREIIIFSADSDMLPAIKRAHSAGVKVIYAACTSAMNRALTTMADEVWPYSEEQIIEAYKRAQHE